MKCWKYDNWLHLLYLSLQNLVSLTSSCFLQLNTLTTSLLGTPSITCSTSLLVYRPPLTFSASTSKCYVFASSNYLSSAWFWWYGWKCIGFRLYFRYCFTLYTHKKHVFFLIICFLGVDSKSGIHFFRPALENPDNPEIFFSLLSRFSGVGRKKMDFRICFGRSKTLY